MARATLDIVAAWRASADSDIALRWTTELHADAASGKSIKEITRCTGRSRKLVRSVLRGGDGDVFRCRIRVLEPHTPMLRAEWEGGCRNGAEL